MKAEQHARRPFRRQVRPDFPRSASQRPAQRHPDRPPPLRPQQIFSYRLSLSFRQSLQPLPHGLASRPRALKNQRDFSPLWGFCHPAPYIVQRTLKCTGRQAYCLKAKEFPRWGHRRGFPKSYAKPNRLAYWDGSTSHSWKWFSDKTGGKFYGSVSPGREAPLASGGFLRV
jgi:hypothetical protein